jgi:photosynthetic reaction center cytochrome c subunit
MSRSSMHGERLDGGLYTLGRAAAIAIVALAGVSLSGCEFGPKKADQNGYRGTGMSQIRDADTVKAVAAANTVPAPLLPDLADPEGPRAKEQYENLQVLGDLSVDEFNRLMIHITEWVVPKAYVEKEGNGCNYCHNPENMASDEVYQKVVARKMLQMTGTINAKYADHVKETGVTCWTCHRGQAVPAYVWSKAPGQNLQGDFLGGQMGQNKPIQAVGWTTSPFDPFSDYLANNDKPSARVQGVQDMKPVAPGKSINKTERTLGIMQHMSNSLGVNCSYCHNTRNFSGWADSNPARVTAWHGLQMTPDLNETYMTPLQPVFAPHAGRVGPLGDVLKVNCSTCHQGAAKPMLGVSMRKDHPELFKIGATVSAPAPTGATEIKLPGGASFTVPAGSIGEQLFKFLTGPEPPPKSFVFDNLTFQTGSAALTAESQGTVDTIARILAAYPKAVGTIDGYTDNVGRAAKNLSLSKARAKTVFAALEAKGVAANRLSHDGFGDAKPIGDNATDEGRQKNRRIELTVTAK